MNGERDGTSCSPFSERIEHTADGSREQAGAVVRDFRSAAVGTTPGGGAFGGSDEERMVT